MQEVQESFETGTDTGFSLLYFFQKKCRTLLKSSGMVKKVQAVF